jgi:hypothetical protein
MQFFLLITVIVVAIAMAPPLAHALESPGKMRLERDQYLSVQTIYYPGFTWSGASEPLGIVLLTILAFLTPASNPAFWPVLLAAASLAAMQAVFWLMTQPVNKYWLKTVQLNASGKAFFDTGAAEAEPSDWTAMRDRWELSHKIRAAFAALAFILFQTAIIIGLPAG